MPAATTPSPRCRTALLALGLAACGLRTPATPVPPVIHGTTPGTGDMLSVVSPPAAASSPAAPIESAPLTRQSLTAFGGKLRASFKAAGVPELTSGRDKEGLETVELTIVTGDRRPIDCRLTPADLSVTDIVAGVLELVEPYDVAVNAAEVTTVNGRMVLRFALACSEKGTGAPRTQVNAAIAVGSRGTLACTRAQSSFAADDRFRDVTDELFATATDFADRQAKHTAIFVPEGDDQYVAAAAVLARDGGGLQDELRALGLDVVGGRLRVVEDHMHAEVDASGEIVEAASWVATSDGGQLHAVGLSRTASRTYSVVLYEGQQPSRRWEMHTQAPLTTRHAQAAALRAVAQGKRATATWSEFVGVDPRTGPIEQKWTARRTAGGDLVLRGPGEENGICDLTLEGLCTRMTTRPTSLLPAGMLKRVYVEGEL
ncbi:hypothetical protein [Nannocystis radixulma]|uniref:Lipoprotein n=1 Tax=Nannocystis radixulma TaxID=2995305 RepID=A0ABT5BPF7_9BACT|nr:hypothetical protein [Nannocystis radixulma]MDC0675419.1 hypothetical protein [Nannocystis radixulma]